MAEHDEIWLPLVDEPIGSIVAQIQADDPEIERLVGSPRRILAFRTFAYIRVGVKLGELLVEHDVPPYDGTESWIELLLRDPAHRAAVARTRCVRSPRRSRPIRAMREEEQLGPDDDARARFREFARKQLDDAWRVADSVVGRAGLCPRKRKMLVEPEHVQGLAAVRMRKSVSIMVGR